MSSKISEIQMDKFLKQIKSAVKDFLWSSLQVILFAFPLMLCWNGVLPRLLEVNPMSLRDAAGIILIVCILTESSSLFSK
jgi:hypothetical protein